MKLLRLSEKTKGEDNVFLKKFIERCGNLMLTEAKFCLLEIWLDQMQSLLHYFQRH